MNQKIYLRRKSAPGTAFKKVTFGNLEDNGVTARSTIWLANSLAGAKQSACKVAYLGSTLASIPITNAIVLPAPLWACAMTLLLLRINGRVDAWISDGFSKRISFVNESRIGCGLSIRWIIESIPN